MHPWSLGSPRGMRLVAAVIAVLLVILAVLQYRWIGEVSRAERQRLRAGLEAAADRFAADLGREVYRAASAFQPNPAPGEERELTPEDRWRRWRENAAQPELVRAVYLVAWEAGGGLPVLSQIDPESGTVRPAGWPAELASLREAAVRLGLDPVQSRLFPFAPDVPAIVLPLHRRFAVADRTPQGMVIVVLDRRFLTEELFPELAERCFGLSRAPDFLVAVQGPGGLVYRSDPSLPAKRYLPGDLSFPLFERHRGDRHRLHPGLNPPPPHREPPPPRRAEADGSLDWEPPPAVRADPQRREGSDRRAALDDEPPRPNPWRIFVSHREGSLEAAVERVRRRNLAVSLGALALLTATLGILGLSTQRARRLARQQLEFVAGVTHELNTPLAAIRSAGQNLADGVVADPQQVKRYGALIEHEGRRLSGMVGKALDLAGIQSGSKTYHPEPVAVAEVVEEALSDYRWMLEERGVAVDNGVPSDLPAVLVDRTALRMVVQNLLDNAVKYAGSARWIGLRGGAGRDGREVFLTIEDHGPGIHPEDRAHLFEPFYRGRGVTGGRIQGSGLGLSLARHAVEAHHGTLSVATGAGGSAFTVRLPTAGEPVQGD